MSNSKYSLEGRRNLLGGFYGTGEYSHLGGCSVGGDAGTYYPIMWSYLLNAFDISSVIDVGCGAGWSVKYFKDNGCNVLGVEGFQEAIDGSPVKENIVKHDYEKNGPYTPKRNYDLCWSAEFVEHVEEDCSQNFLETFKSAKYVAMTYAEPYAFGHHHVNLQPESYWIQKMSENGFVFDPEVTQKLRDLAKEEEESWHKNGEEWFACFHFIERGLFFRRE